MSRKLVESITTMNGELRIDHINGLITFHDGWSRIVLRVSHLREPVPADVLIDIVALINLTSYTPLQGEALQSDLAPLLTDEEREQNRREEERHGIQPH